MIKHITYCDCCGKQLDESNNAKLGFMYQKYVLDIGHFSGSCILDLCPECSEKVKTFIHKDLGKLFSGKYPIEIK